MEPESPAWQVDSLPLNPCGCQVLVHQNAAHPQNSPHLLSLSTLFLLPMMPSASFLSVDQSLLIVEGPFYMSSPPKSPSTPLINYPSFCTLRILLPSQFYTVFIMPLFIFTYAIRCVSSFHERLNMQRRETSAYLCIFVSLEIFWPYQVFNQCLAKLFFNSVKISFSFLSICLFKFIYFSLEDNCFTVLCWFLYWLIHHHSSAKSYACPLLREPPSYLPPHPTLLGCSMWQREKQTSCINSYMWNLKRWYQWIICLHLFMLLSPLPRMPSLRSYLLLDPNLTGPCSKFSDYHPPLYQIYKRLGPLLCIFIEISISSPMARVTWHCDNL